MSVTALSNAHGRMSCLFTMRDAHVAPRGSLPHARVKSEQLHMSLVEAGAAHLDHLPFTTADSGAVDALRGSSVELRRSL